MKSINSILVGVCLLISTVGVADPHSDLIVAIKEQNTENLKAAITSGADVNETFEHNLIWQLNYTMFKKFTPLMLASAMGYEDGVLHLLHAKAKVNATANCRAGILLKCVVSSTKDVTALFLACGNGHEKVVELLMRGKAKLVTITVIKTTIHGCKDRNPFVGGVANFTPKSWAKKNGEEQVIETIKTGKKAKWAKEGLPVITE